MKTILLLCALTCAVPAAGAALPTGDEALAEVFADTAQVSRRTDYLTEEQMAQAGRLAGPDVPIRSALVVSYIGRLKSGGVGRAYFDTHIVRALPATMMIVLDERGRVADVVVVAFHEPPEYLPPAGWLEQFRDRKPGASVFLKGEIDAISGATLTSRATMRAVRRILALDAVLPAEGYDSDQGKGQEG
ncbi:MAG: FMN-binding protein [Candidatus Eisenbacteria bacterium]|nr:FMN-binding protein [Candidatus Eisenbacteria bacterium]